MAGLYDPCSRHHPRQARRGVAIELYALGDDGARRLVASVRTNADGRTDAPLIARRRGAHRDASNWSSTSANIFAARARRPPTPPFLDVVPIRFAIADPKAHYHVPLVATPWSYSTYRGS